MRSIKPQAMYTFMSSRRCLSSLVPTSSGIIMFSAGKILVIIASFLVISPRVPASKLYIACTIVSLRIRQWLINYYFVIHNMLKTTFYLLYLQYLGWMPLFGNAIQMRLSKKTEPKASKCYLDTLSHYFNSLIAFFTHYM